MSIPDDTRLRMEESLEAVQREFATVRTGKATPAILEGVRVEAYGSQMPLNQLAALSVPDPGLLAVQPFDPSMIEAIERAILAAGLGLNPSNDGAVVRVPIPPLSEDRRKEYVRLLNRMAEEGRVSVRRARQAGNDEVKQRLKDHEIGEDDGHRILAEIQKITVEYGQRIDRLLAEKEAEVMAI